MKESLWGATACARCSGMLGGIDMSQMKMYLMKVRIYFTQNNLLNSYEIKSFVSCGMYGQYQSNLAVLKCCAVDFNYTFVPCCRSTAS